MQTSFLCRVGFCINCKKKGYPQHNQKFVTHGTHGYHVDFANFDKHPIGFTPHLYKLVSVVGHTVNCKCICCMDDCTLTISKLDKPNLYNFYIPESAWKSIQMTIADWNALQKFKRDTNYII